MTMKYLIPLLTLSLITTQLTADDIQPLGDEFSSNVSLPQWLRLNDTEGWNADQLETYTINPSYSSGEMVMAPHSSAWYGDLRGVLVYKEITGDFIVTMRMRVSRRGVGGLLPHEAGYIAQEGAPNRNFSLAGIFLHDPRAITSAAPVPVPAGTPTWPPPAEGMPGHFTTDWLPDTDNYLFLSFGSAGNQGTWQYEVKTTVNGTSNLYYNNHGIPVDNASARIVTLQMVKIGNTIVTMRKHDNGPWIVENRYTPAPASPYQQLPPFGNTLQVGITTYTDWNSIGSYFNAGDHATQFQHNYTVFDGPGNNPDLIAFVDYYRFQRPNPALTELTLQALPITFQAAPLGGTAAIELPAGGAGQYLGDNANTPAPSLDDDSDNDGVSNLFEFIMGTNPAVADTTLPVSGVTATDFTLSIPHQNNLNDITLEIQHSGDLTLESWDTLATRNAGGWSFDPPHQVLENANTIEFSTPLGDGSDFYRIQATAP